MWGPFVVLDYTYHLCSFLLFQVVLSNFNNCPVVLSCEGQKSRGLILQHTSFMCLIFHLELTNTNTQILQCKVKKSGHVVVLGGIAYGP